MFQSNLNLYSLLIPIMMLGLGGIVLLMHCMHSLPRYLVSYALALLCIGTSVLLHSTLLPDMLLQFMAGVMLLYFSSCILHLYAISLRLRLPLRWKRLLVIVTCGLLGVIYYTHIQPEHFMRSVVVGLTTSCLYAHHWESFVVLPEQKGLERCLAILLCGVIVLATLRLILIAPFSHGHDFISNHEMIWAVTQFTLIILDVVFLAVFVACAVSDVMKKLKAERNVDALTGCLNRHGLDDHLQQLAQQTIQQHAILLCDLDHFKHINDHYGHQVGDLVLQHFCQRIESVIEHDHASIRIGGEEFIVLLHAIEHIQAYQMAERLRMDIANSPFIYENQPIEYRLSMGVSYFHLVDDFEQALKTADQFLYCAKRTGRNQVKVQHPLNTQYSL